MHVPQFTHRDDDRVIPFQVRRRLSFRRLRRHQHALVEADFFVAAHDDNELMMAAMEYARWRRLPSRRGIVV